MITNEKKKKKGFGGGVGGEKRVVFITRMTLNYQQLHLFKYET